MFGVGVPLDLFRSPKVIQSAPGDTSWHAVASFPPDTTNLGKYAVASVAAAGGAGSPIWLEWNLTAGPADTTKAWLLFGSGQIQVFGGGIQNLYYKLTAATDILILLYES